MTSIADQRHINCVLRHCFTKGQQYSAAGNTRGRVDFPAKDNLSERLKNAYLGARALVGWEFDSPTVEEVR
ncbi:MAG: hypothetical protein R3E42_13115 [Burkholderiaceae bacterium]